MKKNNYINLINNTFIEHVNVANETIKLLAGKIEKSSNLISKSLSSKGTIFWCGNGGKCCRQPTYCC